MDYVHENLSCNLNQVGSGGLLRSLNVYVAQIYIGKLFENFAYALGAIISFYQQCPVAFSHCGLPFVSVKNVL